MAKVSNEIWKKMPQEVRLKVLEAVAERNKNRTAPYAAVSKEWRVFFEQKTFSRLMVTESCLRHLEKYTIGNPSRRAYIRRIWLRIELGDYVCDQCQPTELAGEALNNNGIFGRCIHRLLTILKGWGTEGKLVLEISAASASDSKNTPESRLFDIFPTRPEASSQADTEHRSLTCPGRQRGPEDPARHFATACRLYGSGLQMDDFKLPAVRSVVAFVVRRQCSRKISEPALKQILSSFPRLERVNLEMWRNPLAGFKSTTYKELADIVENIQDTAKIKRLSLFEECWVPVPVANTPYTIRTEALTKALVIVGHRLEHLSVSFLVDAQDIYQELQRVRREAQQKGRPDRPIWPSLITLALTSTALSRGQPHDVGDFLVATADLVRRMPKLRLLEIWHGAKGEAAVFRYSVSRRFGRGRPLSVSTHVVTIVWSSSWVFSLPQRVVQAWREVARSARCEFVADNHAIPAPPKAFGSVLRHLRLREQILDSVSG